MSAHGDEPPHRPEEQTEESEWWTAEDQEFAKSAARRASSIKPADIQAAAARAARAEDHLRSDPWRGALASIPKTYALDAYASSLGTTMLEAYIAALPKSVPGPNVSNLGTTMLQAYSATLRENNPSIFESLAGLRYTRRSMLTSALHVLSDDRHRTVWQAYFAKATESTRASLAALTTAAHWPYLPPNVARCKSPNIDDASAIAEVEGIALFLVPGPEVVTALLDAPDPDARRAILLERADEILTDCETLLDTCVAPEVIPYVPYARKAVQAARAEHHEAAQALAANTLESMFKNVSFLIPVRKFFKTPEVIRSERLAHQLVIWPAAKAHQEFWVHRGDQIPSTFSRHGSAHAVGAVQYTPTNAVQGLLLLVSVIGYVHERARAASL